MRRRILLSKTSGGGGEDIIYNAVDLGLSVLWCDKNVGASTETECGDYYQWGALEPYKANTNQYYTGNTELPLSSDTAAMVIGRGWRMPTSGECKELATGTTRTWETINGVQGVKLTNKTDPTKYIFIPNNGYYDRSSRYWDDCSIIRTTSIYNAAPSYGDNAEVYSLMFENGIYEFLCDSWFKNLGMAVRGVKDKISYSYVDLGLPSGVKWATMNVGASSETDYGVYFQCGSLVPYRNENQYYTGGTTQLPIENDTARAWMGEPWRMPTSGECQELIANTTSASTTVNGVSGIKFTATNGNYIFFPFAGFYYTGSLNYEGYGGYCWSSTPCGSGSESYYYQFTFISSIARVFCSEPPYLGLSVRGVRDAQKIGNYEYVDLGLPSGKLWATMNVGASSVTDYGNYYQYGKGSAQYAETSAKTSYTGTENPLNATADTATQVWGDGWRTPTSGECYELVTQTTITLSSINGVNGLKFTASNGNYVFLPRAGWYYAAGFMSGYCSYQTSTPNGASGSYHLHFDGSLKISDEGRTNGCSVRPIHDRLT